MTTEIHNKQMFSLASFSVEKDVPQNLFDQFPPLLPRCIRWPFKYTLAIVFYILRWQTTPFPTHGHMTSFLFSFSGLLFTCLIYFIFVVCFYLWHRFSQSPKSSTKSPDFLQPFCILSYFLFLIYPLILRNYKIFVYSAFNKYYFNSNSTECVKLLFLNELVINLIILYQITNMLSLQPY